MSAAARVGGGGVCAVAEPHPRRSDVDLPRCSATWGRTGNKPDLCLGSLLLLRAPPRLRRKLPEFGLPKNLLGSSQSADSWSPTQQLGFAGSDATAKLSHRTGNSAAWVLASHLGRCLLESRSPMCSSLHPRRALLLREKSWNDSSAIRKAL